MAVTQQENKGGFRENQILRIEADGFGKKEKENLQMQTIIWDEKYTAQD